MGCGEVVLSSTILPVRGGGGGGGGGSGIRRVNLAWFCESAAKSLKLKALRDSENWRWDQLAL